MYFILFQTCGVLQSHRQEDFLPAELQLRMICIAKRFDEIARKNLFMMIR
jgi:hypothetical protein